MALIDVIVSDITQETPTIKSIRLEKPDGSPLGTYLPGAHIDVEGPTAITRQYSLCSTPDSADSFAFAVKREATPAAGLPPCTNSRSATDSASASPGTSSASQPTHDTTYLSPQASASPRC